MLGEGNAPPELTSENDGVQLEDGAVELLGPELDLSATYSMFRFLPAVLRASTPVSQARLSVTPAQPSSQGVSKLTIRMVFDGSRFSGESGSIGARRATVDSVF
ncbi:MAG: hypothetical protein AAFY60_05720 [Myxococcota bacterium]